MYKAAFVKKIISAKNNDGRTVYGNAHKDKPINGFFDHIVFTDEMHVDPTSQAKSMLLREQGTRYKPENIVERPPLEGVRLHVAGWISWYGKADKLQFYNDEQDSVVRPPMPPKPRRRPKSETTADFDRRMAEWEALSRAT